MRIFLDQDQTLADFDNAFKAATKFYPWDYKKHCIAYLKAKGNNSKEAMRIFVTSFWLVTMSVPGFWERIAPMKDFKKLWRFFKKYDPIVLTAVPEIPQFKMTAIAGKRLWIDKHMSYDTKLLTIELNSFDHKRMDKTIYCEGADDILIDDNERNIRKWTEAGGTAIHHQNAKTTIKEFKNILKRLK